MSIVIRVAEEKDILPVQRLVARAGLSDQGIEDQIDHFLVAENEEKQVIGTVGIERLSDEDGLLRSLVMASTSWDAKIGLQFLELAMAFAKQRGVRTLYLLTNNAIPFFEHIGFEPLREEEIPVHLKKSNHFGQFVSGQTKVMACSLEKLMRKHV
ncbi:GNAT family N-acetyltransferase [Anaerobacillus sp. MEB173]|uniref:GNAT family N-acetyltransferase n=1 Tax=Anaerobacillus sp. MEB173 TaxID=3383345 RepID=UPI003F8FB744